MTDQVAAAIEAPAPADDGMGAIWDKHQEAAEDVAPVVLEEPKAEAPDGPAKAAEAPVEAVADEKEGSAEAHPEKVDAVEAPSDLPGAIKQSWNDIPKEAQDAILSNQREFGRKLAEQGRIVQASKPVYDVLVEATQKFPSLANLTPGQVAKDMFQMATVSEKMTQDPVATILGIANEYGAMEGLIQQIGGQAPDAVAKQNMQLVQEVNRLAKLVEQSANPTLIDDRVNAITAERDTERSVTEFAKGKEHWDAVESVLPQFIPIVQSRLGDGASPQDVLSQAYDMAIHADPDLRAKVIPAAPAPATPDPARTAAQLKAKSVNVGSRPTGGAPQMTEEQLMAAVFDKHQA